MNTQSQYDYVIDRLMQSKGTWPAVAQGSGVPKRTIEKVARKETADPRNGTIQRLFDYFKAKDS